MTKAYQDEIGTLLRRQRETLRLSADTASHALHIRVRYLTALEEGRLMDLPGMAYTKGYLQSYAAYLGLDRDEILRRYEEIEGLLPKKAFYFPEVFSKERKPARWSLWGGLALAVGVYIFWYMTVKPEQTTVSVIERPPEITHLSAPPPADVACLHTQDALYPPCIIAADKPMLLFPWQGQRNSVMDLAY